MQQKKSLAHRAGQRAGAQQVARAEVAAAQRVVRHHLLQRPVPAQRAPATAAFMAGFPCPRFYPLQTLLHCRMPTWATQVAWQELGNFAALNKAPLERARGTVCGWRIMCRRVFPITGN